MSSKNSVVTWFGHKIGKTIITTKVAGSVVLETHQLAAQQHATVHDVSVWKSTTITAELNRPSSPLIVEAVCMSISDNLC